MRILFIGNSHTYYNGLPFQVRELLRLDDPGVETAMCATPGMTLGWHAEQPETQMAILYHPWDYIALQQKSHPFDGYAALLNDCTSLLPYLRRTQAKLLLCMTWAEKKIPANQATLDAAFRRAAHEIKATCVPVSVAWQALLRSEPDLELYDADGEHASPNGSYLAACVFYSVIRQRSPVSLPGRIQINGDELINLSQGDAERIQKAAWSAVRGAAG